jgi:drug/metabolite transporter (DMT)-like permease
MEKAYLLLPLGAGLLYAAGAISIKRAVEEGIGPWRMTFLSIWAMFVLFAPMAFFANQPLRLQSVWPAFACAFFFFLGNIFALLALARGDVSVATPVMGTKVVIVALLVAFWLRQPLDWTVWAAAVMALAGIFFLNARRPHAHGRKLWRTIGLSVCASFSFAITDVILQRWGPVQGVTVLCPAFMGLAAIMTLGLIPFFREPVWRIPRRAWPYLSLGVGLIAIQALGMAIAIGGFGDAPGANIAYSVRGIFSVILVWKAGCLFGSQEGLMEGKTIAARLIGASCILLAVLLVFV